MAEGKLTIKVPKVDIWRILTIVLAAIILAQLLGVFSLTGMVSFSGQQTGSKTIDYINKNLVQAGQASLVSVREISGLYEVITSYQGQQIPVYVTKDGSLLFVSQPINMAAKAATTTTQPQQIPKKDKPEAHAFVMSYCPYGLQFLKAYIPVMELLGSKADLQVNFVPYAMHGKKELDENTRMYCIQKEQQDKFVKYLRCFVQSGDSTKCITEAGVDKTKLESCINSTDKQFNITGLYNDQSTWSGGSYPQYPVEATLASKYDVGGSPTFVLNDVTINVNRAPEAIKQAICSAFKTPPTECGQTLSTNTESPGIGTIGSGSGSTASSGACS